MLAYRLRHQVQLQRKVDARDPETGAVIHEWVPVAFGNRESVPAEVLTGPGQERYSADAKQALTTARINIRWFPVDRLELCRWRILWDGRVYNIVSAETDRTGRREWRLRCEDGLTDGA